MRRILLAAGALVATTLGSGFIPFAPGTIGSVIALALYLLAGSSSTTSALIAGAALVPLAYAGARAGEILWGHDPGRVNIDEVLGTWIACIPAGGEVVPAVTGFLLFRLFDIWKPWPVSFFDRMSGAAGVLLDDACAGLMAAVLVFAGVNLGVF